MLQGDPENSRPGEQKGLGVEESNWQVEGRPELHFHFKGKVGNFPGSPVCNTPCPQCRGLGSVPGRGTRSHMLQLKILCVATKT